MELFCLDALTYFFDKLLEDLDKENNINTKIFSIFSQFLKSIQNSKEGNDRLIDNPSKSDEYLNNIIKDFCTTTKWPSSKASLIINSFNEIFLSQDNLKLIVAKTASIWYEIEIDEIPPFVYQLLLLSKKGLKNQIISQIICYFNNYNMPEKDDKNQFIENDSFTYKNSVEGTILLHLLMAVKQDQNLGLFLIKFLKLGKTLYLSPFTLSILLSLSTIQRFEDEIFSYLKTCLLSYFDDLQKIDQLKEMKRCYNFSSISELFNILLFKSKNGWDQVNHGLVEFFIFILDTVPKAFGQVIETQKIPPQNGYMSSLDQSHSLAKFILLKIYTNIELFQPTIFEKIITRILSNSDSIQQYIKLFSLIIKSSLHQLPILSSKVKDLIPIIISLSLSTAMPLLKAWIPIIKVVPPFLDSLMIVLKKGVFTRSQESRRVSVYGLVLLLKTAPSDTSMKTENSEKGNVNPICLEILGILSRCLSQQSSIKNELYEGLIQCSKECEVLKPYIGEFLTDHAFNYLKLKQESITIGKIKQCIKLSNNKESTIIEPLPMLLKAILSCMINNANHQNYSYMQKSKQIFEDLDLLLKESTLATLGFDKEALFSLATTEGRFNYLQLSLILGIFENIVDYKLRYEEESGLDSISLLIKKFLSFSENTKNSNKQEKGKIIAKKETETTYLSIDSATRLFELAATPYSDGDENGSPLSETKIIHYVLEIFNRHLDKITKNFREEIDSEQNPLQIFALLVTVFISDTKDTSILDEECHRLGYESILKSLVIFYDYDYKFQENFKVILNTVFNYVNIDDSFEIEEVIFPFIGDLISHIKYSDKKLATCQLNIVNKLLKILLDKKHQYSLKEELIELYVKKIKDIFTETFKNSTATDISISKEILKFKLNLGYFGSDFTILPQLADCFRNILSKIRIEGEEYESDDEENSYCCLGFQLNINLNLPPCLNTMLLHINAELDNFAFYIQFIHLQNSLDKEIFFLIQNEKSSIQVEKAICAKLSVFVSAFKLLAETHFSASSTEEVLGCLSKFFKFMNSFIKFKIAAKLVYNKDMLIKLCERIGETLYNKVSTFLTHLLSLDKANATKKRKPKSAAKLPRGKFKKASNSKEIRIVSSLVLNIENFENSMIQIAKIFKLDIMQKFKRTVIRDYRINRDIFLRSPSPEINLKEEVVSNENNDDSENEENDVESVSNSNHETPSIVLLSDNNEKITSPSTNETINKKKKRRKRTVSTSNENDSDQGSTEEVNNVDTIGFEENYEDYEENDRYDSDMIDDSEL
ncbi:hypothetical protein K502DRAFT_322556 [Neoconidiobolus thromboides FSU 785]|nr:hypothetical protein K502DRAFT_322556 [Neoconidiobolus thromboides FSU 785]